MATSKEDDKASERNGSRRAANRKDHRAALQANRLRMNLATEAIRFGRYEPTIKPKTLRILIVSLIIACILIIVTIGGATILQMMR